jgi:hypothetical protein
MRKGMNKIVFTYQGKKHTGYIVSSTNLEPHYHWFYFNDQELINEVDECIGFKIQNNVLTPTRSFRKHNQLVETVKDIVEQRVNVSNNN